MKKNLYYVYNKKTGKLLVIEYDRKAAEHYCKQGCKVIYA